MKFLKKIDWLGFYACLVIPFILLVLIGALIPEWGQWYAAADWYRPQVSALAEGHLSQGSALGELQHDNTWSGGGVHQVWGLGVPFLRLPFELLARLCWFEVFPDRLILGFWIFCVTFWGYTVLVHQCSSQ